MHIYIYIYIYISIRIYIYIYKPQHFTDVTMVALNKKTNATKCSDYRTISFIAHTAKIIAKIL